MVELGGSSAGCGSISKSLCVVLLSLLTLLSLLAAAILEVLDGLIGWARLLSLKVSERSSMNLGALVGSVDGISLGSIDGVSLGSMGVPLGELRGS